MRSWFLRLLVRSTQKWGGEVPTLDVLKEIDNCEKKCLEFKVSSNPGFHIWTWIKTSLKIPSVNDLYYCLCFLLKLNPGAKSISDLPLYQKSCSKWWTWKSNFILNCSLLDASKPFIPRCSKCPRCHQAVQDPHLSSAQVFARALKIQQWMTLDPKETISHYPCLFSATRSSNNESAFYPSKRIILRFQTK